MPRWKKLYACVKENNIGRDSGFTYIQVLEMERGTIELETAELHYEEGGKPDPPGIAEPVRGVAQPPVHRRRVADEPHREPPQGGASAAVQFPDRGI